MNKSTGRSEYDTQALSVEQARESILESLWPVSGEQRLALRQALGRVLAGDVSARIDVPPQTNSAMDGYAVRHADLSGSNALRIIGTSWAGRPCARRVEGGEAVRIMTGAVMPAGADTGSSK